MTGSRRGVRLAFSLAAVGLVAGCFPDKDAAGGTQGWGPEEREAWYVSTQGSRLMPLAWFMALPAADGSGAFADPAHLARYGFLPPPEGRDRPLPVGFTADRQDDEALRQTRMRWYEGQPGTGEAVEPWVGLNCAACHTGELTHQGKAHRIDGGPALIDFQSFIEDLDAALHATRDEPARWETFAAAVLGDRDTAGNRDLLAAEYQRLLDWQDQTAAMNHTALRYGRGRLDAVGHILNKVLMFNGAPASAGNAANAPVSFPFLWGISKQQHVQWNGIAENSRFKLPGDAFEYGALGRNTGEVLGVFGDLVVTPQTPGVGALIHYKSSVRTENLVRMELLVKKLAPPAWPADFPAIDEGLRARGDELFDRMCASCHLPEDHQREGRPTEVMVPFIDTPDAELTDIWMACNAYTYRGPTGPMEGVQDNTGAILGAQAPVANMLATAVRGALIGDAKELVKAGIDNFFGIRPLPEFEDGVPTGEAAREIAREVCLTTADVPILGYKARPLDGIWATAPYLHNGSVASLADLLLPPDQRKPQFWVGNREFDPVAVGYVDADPGNGMGFLMQTRDGAGAVIEGNSNAGHVYGVGSLSAEDRAALLEYLKSL